jgi:hypothetical protein
VPQLDEIAAESVQQHGQSFSSFLTDAVCGAMQQIGWCASVPSLIALASGRRCNV